MSRTCTVGELKTRTREAADAVGDTSWVTDGELSRYLDNAYTELVDLLLSADIHLYETHADSTTDGITDLINLPADFYKLLGVDFRWATSPERFISVPVVTFSERNRYIMPFVSPLYGAYAAGYRLIGTQVKLYPLPPAQQTYRLHYVPTVMNFGRSDWAGSTAYALADRVLNSGNLYTCSLAGTSAASGGPTTTGTLIVDGTAKWDFVAKVDSILVDGLNGYDEALVLTAAMKMARKEGNGAALAELRQERGELIARVAQMAVDRQPVQSMAGGRDVDRRDRFPYSGGYNWGGGWGRDE